MYNSYRDKQMKTISSRIENIKEQIDELEAHVNSTLSVLNCKAVPLIKELEGEYEEYKEYKEYKNWKWKTYNSYAYADNNFTLNYKTEENTIKKLSEFKDAFDAVHEKNKEYIKENELTFNKICDFFDKLGLSRTTYASSGKGKNYRSHKVDSQWVEQLKRQYPMKDELYDHFISWHKEQEREIKLFFGKLKETEREKKQEEEHKRIEEEEQQRQKEEKTKAINLATEFLVLNGKKEGVDFNNDNAINKAFELKTKILNQPQEPKTEKTEETKKEEKEKIRGNLDRMEV